MDTFIVLSDLHGNYEALKSVVNDSIRKFGPSIKGFLFLGDYCCDFLEGEECIQMMLALKHFYPVYAISGNRETGMVMPYEKKIENGEAVEWDIESTMGAPLLACQRFSKQSLKFIMNLPESFLLKFGNAPSLYLQHKMPLSPEKQKWLESKGVRYVLTAHTHEPHTNTYGNFTMFNPGSVGLTDTGIPGADYGVLTLKDGDWHMKQIHIPYNYQAQIKAVTRNNDLMKKCKCWGVALNKSIEIGVNVTALYMFEVNRMADALARNEPMDSHISFCSGRYGNVSPINTLLEERILDGNRIVTVYHKTDEFNPKNPTHTPVQKPDWLYPLALDKVIRELDSITNIREALTCERLERVFIKKYN